MPLQWYHLMKCFTCVFQVRKNVPCYVPEISCGRQCGKRLACGHKCIKKCHKVDHSLFFLCVGVAILKSYVYIYMLKIQQYKRKTHGFCTCSCFGPHIWNSLPQDLRHCSAFSSFKAKLKIFLFSQYFCPQLISVPSFCYSQCKCVCVSVCV